MGTEILIVCVAQLIGFLVDWAFLSIATQGSAEQVDTPEYVIAPIVGIVIRIA